MPNNDQILLSELLKQEADALQEPFTESEFFEFYSALQILKEYELSYEEIKSGIAGQSLDGGAETLLIFVLLREVKKPVFMDGHKLSFFTISIVYFACQLKV